MDIKNSITTALIITGLITSPASAAKAQEAPFQPSQINAGSCPQSITPLVDLPETVNSQILMKMASKRVFFEQIINYEILPIVPMDSKVLSKYLQCDLLSFQLRESTDKVSLRMPSIVGGFLEAFNGELAFRDGTIVNLDFYSTTTNSTLSIPFTLRTNIVLEQTIDELGIVPESILVTLNKPVDEIPDLESLTLTNVTLELPVAEKNKKIAFSFSIESDFVDFRDERIEMQYGNANGLYVTTRPLVIPTPSHHSTVGSIAERSEIHIFNTSPKSSNR